MEGDWGSGRLRGTGGQGDGGGLGVREGDGGGLGVREVVGDLGISVSS